ncbi:aryl-sulfate sulfotransferase [Streptomyces sp. NPDC052043]|uniref:aryl-sulfate sulfotransferase n=1 Tax=Streptomyces sp. NPDC052043 TaxID=3365684 RepID=UPI0037D4EAF7
MTPAQAVHPAAPELPPTPGTPPAVDQVTRRRTGLGLRAHDPALAYRGYTLITPSFGGRTTYLIDMDGREVHRWELPWPPGLGSRLTERGTLLYSGRVVDPRVPFLGTLPFKGGVVAEVAWDGTVLWSVEHPTHHHDAILLRNGNVLLLGLEEVPAALRHRVRGGVEAQETMYADTLVEMTTTGETVWEWSASAHLDPDTDVIGPGPMDRSEWTHANGVLELPDGDLLLSARQISTLLVVDRADGAVRRRIGSGFLAGQHAPSLSGENRVLVFDNGFQRQHPGPPFSRVVEFDLRTGDVLWTYTDPVPFDFFSALQSGAQRLPGGTTLVCEGLSGRVFEVTPEGATVWEYVNPYFVTSPLGGDVPAANRMFRALRYSPELIDPLLGAPTTSKEPS